MNFGDFTDGNNPGANDYIAGYRAGGGVGSDRRWLRSTFANPPTDDSMALGSTTYRWSDVFLASGAVLNFNSSDVTITHGSNALDFAGATAGYSFDNLTRVTQTGYTLVSLAQTPSKLLVAEGSAASPVTAGDTPTVQISRIESIVNGTSTGDGSLGACLSVNLLTDNTQQANAFKASVTTNPSSGGSTNDNVAIYGSATMSGNASQGKNAYSGFFHAAVTTAGNGVVAMGTSIHNSTGTNATWDNAAPVLAALDAVAEGGKTLKAGVVLRRDAVGSGFDVGIGAWAGGVSSTFLRTDSNSTNILKSTATHTDGIDMSSATISGYLLRGPGDRILLDGSDSFTPSSNADAAIVVGGGFGGGLVFKDTGRIGLWSQTSGQELHIGVNGTSGGIISQIVLTQAALSPSVSDGTALGTTSLKWSDLHLAAGAVTNWNNGAVTLTESSKQLQISASTATGAMLSIENTDAGTTGPIIDIYHNSATPAGNDVIGYIRFNGRNSTPALATYASIQSLIYDTTAGAEYGFLRLTAVAAGSNKSVDLAFGELHPATNDGVILGSASNQWSDLYLASGALIDFSNNNFRITHSSGLLTLSGGSLKLAAGSTSAAPLLFQAGTNLTSAADGAMEFDGQSLFFSPDASDRRILPAMAICRLHAGYTLADSTSLQKIFNATTNGTVTLPAGSYIFEAIVCIDTMSATGGNAALSIVGAGGATVSNLIQVVVGIDGAKATAGAAAGASWSVTTDAPVANTSVVTAGTSTEMAIMWKGSFETTAGTLIPSVDLITGGVTPVVKLGSYFMCWRMGGATDVTQGNWS